METVQSKIDDLTTYKLVGNHITVDRDGESVKFKINNSEMISRFREEIQSEINELIDIAKGCNCEECGKRYIRISHNSKYCCDTCKEIAKDRRYKRWYAEKGREKAREYYNQRLKSAKTEEKPKEEKPKKKHVSQLIQLSNEANERKVSYGMLQAEKYMQNMKGVQLEIS